MDVDPLAPPPSGVDPDAWAAACQAVRTYCRWHIAPQIVQPVTVDGSGGRVQLLPTLRLVALEDVVNGGVPVAGPEWSGAGMVRLPGCGRWTDAYRGVSATMTHGYGECPADVLRIVSELVTSGAAGGFSQVSSGAHQVTFEPAMSQRQRDVLDSYRLVWLS